MYVIWDWNGTLLNDAQISFDILNMLLTRHGFAAVESIEKYREIFGFPIEEYYIRAGFDFQRVSYAQLAHEYTEEYLRLSRGCPLQNSAEQTLKAIKEKGMSQIILSASKQSVLNEQLKGYNIEQYFEQIVGTSDVYAAGKTQAALLWKEQSGVQNAVMCGDTVHDFEVAKALGATPVLYCKGHHTKQTLLETGAAVIEHLSDILKHV